MMIMTVILVIFVLFYCGFIFLLIIGNIISKSSISSNKFPPISVIIAIRNGEKSLSYLINDLLFQNYQGDHEFILVDDESDDQTNKIIKDISKKDDRFIYETSCNGDKTLMMKKKALDAGIKKANNDWLLFTDVDCRLPSDWIFGMSKYCKEDTDYIIGYSEVKSGRIPLNIFQSLDFFLLLIAAKGSAYINFPIACTGQNQAYRKNLFKKVGGFSKISKELQGDDSLFLNICKKWGNANVVFADDINCRVISRQEKKWSNLLKQRIRWSGDAVSMFRINVVFFFLLLIFFWIHFSILILILYSIFFSYYNSLLIKSLIIKFIIEFSLYSVGSFQLGKSINMFNFLIWYSIHVPYIVLMGFCSFFANQISWKGRKFHSRR